jgi:ferredoxin
MSSYFLLVNHLEWRALAPARTSFRLADPNDKVPGQASGRYYVDSQCIDCDLCRETAPANFIRNDEAGFSFVYKQPETPEEETLCKDALDNCPVEAIGNDG